MAMAGTPLRDGVLGEFARVHDPRSRRGRRYPLEGLLAMLILASLHGERSLRGMWMWGKQHWAEIRQPLGFLGNRRAPAYGTLHGVVSALSADALDEALGAWSQAWAGEQLRGISIDGKTLRGSRRTNPSRSALEVLTAAGQELQVVLGQRGVAEGEVAAAAVALLRAMALEGKVVTADAGLLNRPVVEAILAGGGDYLGVVKDNQPALHQAIEDWVDPQISPPGGGASSR
jgi:hypothetical protein